jgi:hypothetical protein
MAEIKAIKEEFISHEKRNFKFSLGKIIASSLSGFIAGIIVTVIFFLTLFDVTLKEIVK